jgi:hypothetical protein
MKKILFAVLFAAYILIVTGSCTPVQKAKTGCSGANSKDGSLPYKWKG